MTSLYIRIYHSTQSKSILFDLFKAFTDYLSLVYSSRMHDTKGVFRNRVGWQIRFFFLGGGGCRRAEFLPLPKNSFAPGYRYSQNLKKKSNFFQLSFFLTHLSQMLPSGRMYDTDPRFAAVEEEEDQ